MQSEQFSLFAENEWKQDKNFQHKPDIQYIKHSKRNTSKQTVEPLELGLNTQQICRFCLHRQEGQNGWDICSKLGVQTLPENWVCKESDLWDGQTGYGNLYRIEGHLVAGTLFFNRKHCDDEKRSSSES